MCGNKTSERSKRKKNFKQKKKKKNFLKIKQVNLKKKKVLRFKDYFSWKW